MAEATPPHLVGLNDEQRRAVTGIEGPMLVLAGAGSGKTRVLTRRIAHLLHCGVDAKQIMAVTFTNKAATEMKERVVELVGEAGEDVWVATFHATCARLLRSDIERLGWTRRFAIYDDDDQLRLVKLVCEELGLIGADTDDERIHALRDPRRLLGRIDHFKNRMIGPDAIRRQLRARPDDPLPRVYEAYQDRMQMADAVDFNDLVNLAVRVLDEHPEALENWRERFRYLLVDEYQDTNRAQYRFLQLLAAESRNLMVVGDDDQSIYAFRGADISIILGFERDFPDAEVIRLEQNYRSTGHILAVANKVVANNTGRKVKALRTDAPDGHLVMLKEEETPEAEAEYVARAIQLLRRRGHPWTDFAVIYRTNFTSRMVESSLRRHGIPLRIIGGKKLYERREVRDILAYLRLLVNPADDAALLRVINVPRRGVGVATLRKLRQEAASRGEPLLVAARGLSGGPGVGAQGLAAFVAIHGALTEASRDLEPDELVAKTCATSGYWAMLQAEGTKEARSRQQNLAELVADARAFEAPEDALTPIERLVAWLDTAQLAGADEQVPDQGEVTLMTVHSAKGLEFPIVFVVQMVEGQFPHHRSAERRADVEEERRLAYVAFTRAQQRLLLTRSRFRHPKPGAPALEEATPSRYLFEVDRAACKGDFPDEARTTEEVAPKVEPGRAFSRPEPAEEETVIEVYDPAALRPGVRVVHRIFGRGKIVERTGERITVLLDRGTSVAMPAVNPMLRLVQ